MKLTGITGAKAYALWEAEDHMRVYFQELTRAGEESIPGDEIIVFTKTTATIHPRAVRKLTLLLENIVEFAQEDLDDYEQGYHEPAWELRQKVAAGKKLLRALREGA